MKKTLLVFVACLGILGSLCAQQSPWLVFYRKNWNLLNPAAVDVLLYPPNPDESVHYTFGSRLEGLNAIKSPFTVFASLEGKHNKDLQIGLQAYYDRTDAISCWQVSGNLRYLIDPQKKSGLTWSFGYQPGIFAYQVNAQKLVAQNPADPLFDNYEKIRLRFDFGFGVFVRRGTDSYAGLSSPGLLSIAPGSWKLVNNHERMSRLDLVFGRFFDKYDHQGDQRDYQGRLEVSGWLRMASNSRFRRNSSIFSVDVNARFYSPTSEKHKGFWIGAGLGTNGVASMEVGFLEVAGDDRRYRLSFAGSFPFYPAYRFGKYGTGLEITLTIPAPPLKGLETDKN